MAFGSEPPSRPIPTAAVITIAASLETLKVTVAPADNDLWHIEPRSPEARAILDGLRRDALRPPEFEQDFAGPR